MSRVSEVMEAEIPTESLISNKDSLGIPTETLRIDGTTTEDDALRRQEQESIELARQLMEEEAMASYEQHFGMIREDELSPEDFAALQSALREETDGGGEDDYDAMLELSERIGNVKSERWGMIARKMIDKLESFEYSKNHPRAADAEAKCLVCQCDYEEGEQLRRLPCNHCFHQECVDEWLLEKDICPYCRESIVGEHDADTK